MTASIEQLRRVAAQHLETLQLLGVDFVPLRAVETIEPATVDAEATDAEFSPARRTEGSPMIDVKPSAFEALSDAAIRALSNSSDKQAALDRLRAAHDSCCGHCTVVTTHTQTVFGEGNPDAALMFIGEAPGAEEDRTGRPFVGRAGQKLNDIIKAMKLVRENVYIANVLKARPPDNRTPMPDEVAACSLFLVEQVRIIQPKVIVTLGGPATKLILNTSEGITRVRGVWGVYRAGEFEIPVMPTFHPAYLLRNYTPDTRAKVWSDVKAVMDRLGL